MKTEGIESIPNGGLRVSTATFARIKAFQGGGDYWDHQDLIRESLGEFLPQVQQGQESGTRFGIFRKSIAGKEVLCKSTPLGSARVPEHQVRRLTDALDAFKKKADAPENQQNARDIIQQFRLPDIAKDPELYRLYGPWWDRNLQVLWGCERIPDSSLAPAAAVAKLPIDKAYGIKRALSLLALLLLLCAILAACIWGWPALRKWYAKTFNKPPTAALRVDSLDETNRVAAISDNNSLDPDGTLKHWRIAWGDGKEDNFDAPPLKVAHTYDSERDSTISLWCADNYGAISSPPAQTNIHFAFLKRQKALDQAQREADRIREEARALKEDAQKQKDQAAQQAEQAKKDQEKAKQEQEQADKKKADAEAAQQKAKAAQEAAEQAKTNPPPVVQVPPTPSPAIPPAPVPVALPVAAVADIPAPEPSEKPSRPEAPNKGATDLLRPEPEIIKGRVGRLAADNTLEAVLVVRDRAHPNTSLEVIEWVVDDKAYRSGNAQLTTRLSITEHVVSVKVSRRGITHIAKARVVVTGSQSQTTEPDFIVSPLR